MNYNKVIGLGETVYDIIFRNDQPLKAVPGGSAFNAIISLGRCGAPCLMCSEVGDDRVGSIVTRFLAANGVQTDYVYRHPGTQSHISLAFLNERNDAEYQFYKMHDALSMPLDMPEVNAGDILLFGSYFAVNPMVRHYVCAMLERANAAQALIYYDVNFRRSHLPDLPEMMPRITHNMQMATVVRGSREDFQLLFDSDDPDEVYEKHIAPICDTFIYTDADQPVRVFTPRFRTQYAAKPIQTVSTIGAGDNFNAGFCYALTRCGIDSPQALSQTDEKTFAKLISYGQRFSSHVCQSLDNYVSTDFAEEIKELKN